MLKRPVIRAVTLLFILLMFSSPITISSQYIVPADNNNIPFYIALVFHVHQPIYDVSRNICDLVSNTDSDVYRVFRDRSIIYTYYLLDLIDYIEDNDLPVNITIDITGTTIENFINLTSCASSIPGLENYTNILLRWNSRTYEHVEFVSTMYYYNILPMLTRISDEETAYDLYKYGVEKHSEALESFTGKQPGLGSVTGYYPAELALDNEALELIARYGYNYTFVDDLHIYRIFPDYPVPRRLPDTWYTGREVDVKTDQLYLWGRVLGNWIYLTFEVDGTNYYYIMNPEIGLRPHYISTDYGHVIVFPRNRFFSIYLHNAMYFHGDDIEAAVDRFFEIISYLQQYNTDPDRPFILTIVFDADNGDPLTHYSTWWEFIKNLIANVTTPGSPYSYVKFVSPAWYLENVYNPLNDREWVYAELPFIEPGSWNTDNGWGDPYFTKWIYPSKYSNEQKMLNQLTKAYAYYVNAKYGAPDDPRLNDILKWLSIASQSDWYYYALNEYLDNVTYAVEQAISIANSITSHDHSWPVIVFGWFENPYNNYWPGLIYSDTHPWIKIHVWDTSPIQSVKLDIVLENNNILSYDMSEEPDFPGNYYVQITDDLPMGSVILLNITAIDQYGRISYLEYVLGKVVDTKFKLDGVPDSNARVLWVNTTNNVLQYLVVNDTTNYIYIGFNTTVRSSGYDTFLFISSNPSKERLRHPWNKIGYVPYYDYYIGMEENNGWSGLWIRLNGEYGVRNVLIKASWIIDYVWDPDNGYCEVLISKNTYSQYYSTDRLFLGIASWGSADYSYIYEKLRMISEYSSLYNDELIGIYLGDPYLKPYFMPEEGVEALNFIIEAIRSAKSYIYIAMYNWANLTENSLIWTIAEEIVDAKNRGVWIAVVVDGDHQYTDPINYLRDNGIYVRTEYGTGRMHNKFIVIDGVITFTGSANLVDTAYISLNGEYQYNDVLEIHSSWFSKPYEYEFIEMRYENVFQGGDPTPSQLVNQLILLNNTWVNVTYYFPPEEGSILENDLNNLIMGSNTVYALLYLLTRDSIGDSLINKYLEGGDVKIVLDYGWKDALGTEYYKLIENHVPTALNYDDKLLPGYQLLHHKLFILDTRIVVTGSTNPTTSGLIRNDENTVIIRWDKLANIYYEWFKKIWDKYVARITVKVYEGDKPADQAFVNITTYDLGELTNNMYTWYNYTGYTGVDGLFYVETYLWNPDPTARFLINVSTPQGWNTTIIYLGLDNNSVYLNMWITIYVKPIIDIIGPTTASIGETVTYEIQMTYPNGTLIDKTMYLEVYVNDTYITTILLSRGKGTWEYVPQSEDVYNISFLYHGGDWINGIELLPSSNYVLLKASYNVLNTQLIVSGPSTKYYGEEVMYSIELRDLDGNLIPINTSIEIYINNTLVEVLELNNGFGTWIFEYELSGIYSITFSYPGGDIYNGYRLSSSSRNILLEIREAPTTISINAPRTVLVNKEFTITISLRNTITGEPIADAYVEIYLNNTLYYSGYTSSTGTIVLSYKSETIGELVIEAKYYGEPGKYLATDTSITVIVVSAIPTKIVVYGPQEIYADSIGEYRIELRYLNDTIIDFNGYILLYLNGSREYIQLTNGVAEYTVEFGRSGVYNLTIVFTGALFYNYKLLGSNKTLIINVYKRPVVIEAIAKYTWLNTTHIHLYLEINVRDNLTGEPVNTGYVEIYVNKTGTYDLVARINVTSNKIIIDKIVDPIDPTIKIIYYDPTSIYTSGETDEAYLIINNPTKISPVPEPPYVYMIMIIALLLASIYLSLIKHK